MTTLKIGQLAARSDVPIDTIRYYEREGLLARPDRRPSGYRQFDESAVKRLEFIRDTKELGFTLGEIRELLRLWFDTDSRCEHVRQLAQQKVLEIEQKLVALRAIRRDLKRILSECDKHRSKSECPLMHGLNGQPRRPRTRSTPATRKA